MAVAQSTADPVIDIRDLSVGFRGRAGGMIAVLRNVDLAVCPGESVGIVGESGSGKSTLALAAMGYLKHGLARLGGQALFAGQDMFALKRPALERVRGGKLGLVPQNSGQSLTPTHRVGRQLLEASRLHCDLPKAAHGARIRDLLAQVRLPDPEAISRRYPHELSGGQQQRVAIAMALAGEPAALILDEPTTGLDVTTQAHILDLLRDLAAAHSMAMVYVSHDLGVIARVCERVQVMYAGEVVLDGPARKVLRAPQHPYARALLAAIPGLGAGDLPRALDGRPPEPGRIGAGCAFAPRCALATDACRAARPGFVTAKDGTATRCIYPDRMEQIALRAGPQAAPAAQDRGAAVVLRLDAVSISHARHGLVARLRGAAVPLPTVAGLTLRLNRGETLGLVGESGSGKSTILKALAGLVPPAGGRITLGGDTLPGHVDRRSPAQRRSLQMVFQNPDESLNPRHSVATLLAQPLHLYHGLKGRALTERAVALLDMVRLGAHCLDRRPAQLSGGEKQRVAIARAFAAAPDIVLCDEITSALDVSVQAAVLRLLCGLQAESGTAFIFVSHDLAVVRALSDRVAVLYHGRLCEIGPVAAVYDRPAHPYTEVLLDAVPDPDPGLATAAATAGAADTAPPGRGCPFQRRCPRRLGPQCDTDTPPWHAARDGHTIRCHIPPDALRAAQTATSNDTAGAGLARRGRDRP